METEAEKPSLKKRLALWFAKRVAFNKAVRWLSESIGRPLKREEKAMVKKLFLTIFGASWETTLFGWLATAVGITTTVGWFTAEGKPNYGVIVFAIIAAVFARKVKSESVTGGTRPNSPSPF